MKKYILLVSISLLSGLFTQAKQSAEIGLSSGVVNYVGDLANEKLFPFTSASIGSAVTIRNFLGNSNSLTQYRKLDLQLRFSWHRLQYDETAPIGNKKGMDLRNYLRGLNFRNDLYGSEINVTYNIVPNRAVRFIKPKFAFFFSAGLGVFYGTPKADLFRGAIDPSNRYFFWKDGTIRDVAENAKGVGNVINKDGDYETNLRDWMTEGQGFSNESKRPSPYSNWNIGIPLGAGIRFIYNKQITFSAEFNYYYFFTDYLDDVSGRYATYEELKTSFPNPINYLLAQYISDPTGRGTTGVIGPTTSPRGNPGLKDGFTYLSLEAAYKFSWKGKKIYGR